jgi:hypothetical protein
MKKRGAVYLVVSLGAAVLVVAGFGSQWWPADQKVAIENRSVGSGGSPAGRASQESDDEKVPMWKRLIVSDVVEQRMAGQRALLDNGKQTVEYLLSVLNSPVETGEQFYESTSSRNIAISLLGSLRAREATGELTKWLTAKPGQGQTVWEEMMFSPAGYALVEIGLPSVPPVIELLASDGDAHLREQCIKIIVSIKGLRETEVMLEDLLASETSLAKKEKLEAVQAMLQDPKFRKALEKLSRRGSSR